MLKIKYKGKYFIIIYGISLFLAIFQIGFSAFCIKYEVSSKTQNIVFLVLGCLITLFSIICGLFTFLARGEKVKGKHILWIRIKTICYIITSWVSFLYLIIYYILFKLAPLEKQMIGEKEMMCSKYGCKNLLWFGIASIFFLFLHANQMYYKFKLFDKDKIIKYMCMMISLYPLFYLLILVLPSWLAKLIKKSCNKSDDDEEGSDESSDSGDSSE